MRGGPDNYSPLYTAWSEKYRSSPNITPFNVCILVQVWLDGLQIISGQRVFTHSSFSHDPSLSFYCNEQNFPVWHSSSFFLTRTIEQLSSQTGDSCKLVPSKLVPKHFKSTSSCRLPYFPQCHSFLRSTYSPHFIYLLIYFILLFFSPGNWVFIRRIYSHLFTFSHYSR